MLLWCFLSAISTLAQSDQCALSISVAPTSPVPFGQPVTVTVSRNFPAMLTVTAPVSLDNQQFCTYANPAIDPQNNTCPAAGTVFNNLAPGNHTVSWTCTVINDPLAGPPVSGSTPFSVGSGEGSIDPKYIVLSVIYAPPGQQSFVDYGTSTMIGNSTAIQGSFKPGNTITVTLQLGPKGIDPDPNAPSVQGSRSFTQSKIDNQSIAINKTTSSDIVVKGPANSSQGINHDFDVILLWLNPRLDLTFTGASAAGWNGYTFDPRDPANEMDVVPVYVAWLKNPSTMPPGVAAALARSWAPTLIDGSGPGLTQADFNLILAKDPFANGSTAIDPVRFDLTGQVFDYAPPANGSQPITETFSLDYLTTSTTGKTVSDMSTTTFAVEGSVAFAGIIAATLVDSHSLTIKSQVTQTVTQATDQKATLALTGPPIGYNGPTQVQVFKDNIYGTFMFSFVPETQPSFSISATPFSQAAVSGGNATYTVTASAFNGFSGSINLSASGAPGCGTVTFSAASITPGGSSVMTVPACSVPGNFTITITGTSGNLTDTAQVELVVGSSPFLVLAAPAAQAISSGQSTTYTVSSVQSSTFTGSIALTVSGLPTGATASFNPTSISGGATSTLTVTTVSSTPQGLSTLTITGNSGGSQATTTTSLVVSAPPSQTGTGCSVSFTLTPSAPVEGQPMTYAANFTTIAGNLANGTVNLDGQPLCSASGMQTSCSVTQNAPPSGTHALQWSCTSSGSGGSGTGSGSQTFDVAGSGISEPGFIKPKFVVLSVLYAPPGQTSTVDYSASTVLGTSSSFEKSFSSTTTSSTTSGIGLGIGKVFHIGVSTTNSLSLTQTVDTTSSIAINKTNTFDIKVPGPANSSDGINHDSDVILVWLNPVVNFTITGKNTAQWTGFGFDGDDPVNEVDVVPLYVFWLKNPSTMPDDIKAALARTWADPLADGSGPGLTSGDFQAILKSDPFTDPTYILSLAPGATTTGDNRFDLQVGETLPYEPPPAKGQPLTEIFGLTYQNTQTAGLKATDQSTVGFSTEFSVDLAFPIGKWITLNFNSGSSNSKTLVWTNTATQTTSQGNTQTATLSLTGPSSAYTGPTDIQVFKDNVYGTFMFAFNPFASTPQFTLWSAPDSQTLAPGGSTTYSISALGLDGFSGSVALSASGAPAGITTSFNPASITGTASSTLTVTVASTVAAGTYPLTITGTSGSVTASTNIQVIVLPATFALTGTPATQTVTAGLSTTYAVSSTAIDGFTGSVSLAVSGLPKHASGSFDTSTISGTSVATLTVSTASTVPAGTYPFTVTGTSGAITQTETLTLVVDSVPFVLASFPASRTINRGDVTTYIITTSPVGSFNANVFLSVTGLPPGATATFSSTTLAAMDAATVTIDTTQSTAPPGAYTLTFTGTSSQSMVQQFSVPAGLQMAAPTVSNGCSVSMTLNPDVPAAGQATAITPTVTGLTPSDTGTVSISVDGQMLCSTSGAACTTNPLSGGMHTILYSCTTAGGGSGSGSQFFAVGTAGSINPKYQVLSVIYAPPGKSSTVDYGTSASLGSSVSYADSFTSNTSHSSTREVKRKQPIGPTPVVATIDLKKTKSASFEQTVEDDLTVTASKKATADVIEPGPQDSLAGINHDFDTILLWINPKHNLVLTGTNSVVWNGMSFDPADPVNETDVVPVYVAWLKNPSLMPPGVQEALARTWAAEPLDGSGRGLTNADFQQILNRDPFATGGTAIDPNRFVLTGETFAYAAPPNGGQPITQQLALSYQQIAEQSSTASDSYTVGFSATSPDMNSLLQFLGQHLHVPNPAQVSSTTGKTFTFANKTVRTITQTTGQTSTLSLTGPPAGYTGPTDLQVYQDSIYGTFMFSFVPPTTFHVLSPADSQTTSAGGTVSYPITATTFSGFTGPITLGTSGLPTGATPSFSPASLSGAGSSTLTINVASTVPVGIYPFIIQGTVANASGGETHGSTARLVVVPPNGFLLAALPANQIVPLGSAASYLISTEAMNGFSGTVNLSASGLPAMSSASFNPPSITGIGSSTMTIPTTSGTPLGNSTIAITGTSGSLPQATATVNLLVVEAPTQNGCTVAVAINPPQPILGQLVTYTATVQGATGDTVRLSRDHQMECAGTDTCAAVEPTPPAGTHVLEWSCTGTNNSGSGTQPFTVGPVTAPGGSVNPKYVVVSVIYTPPGKNSTVDYGSSTILGTKTSISNSQSQGLTVSLTGSPKFIPPKKKILPPPPFPTTPADLLRQILSGSSANITTGFMEAQDDTTSIAINKTNSFDITVPGLDNPTDGINHDYDVILLWINPVVSLDLTSNSTGQLPGYSFDTDDPANEVDVVPVYVKWLKDPSTMPPGTQTALARLWAAPPLDGTGPGLTTADFTEILKRDPFANGSTTIAPARFDLQAGETFAYEPPPDGGQPINQKFSLAYQIVSSLGQTAIDEYQVGFSLEAGGDEQIYKNYLNLNLKFANKLVWTNKVTKQASQTQTLTQTATLSLTGPCLGYTGPTDVQVYRDNIYGTFMFSFVNPPTAPDFSLCASPGSRTINGGASDTYTVSTSPANGFTGDVALSVTGLPAGVTASFSQNTIPGGAGSSILTVNVGQFAVSGTSTLTITATNGTLTHTAHVTLVVNGMPNFVLSATPATQTVLVGGSTTYAVSSNALNGLTGNVALTVAGLPAGATASFSPSSITGSTGTSTLTVTSGSTPAANSTLTITGTNGTVVQTFPVTLSVVDFTLVPAPATQAVVVGASTTYTVSTTAVNGFNGTVTPTVTGLPAGATATFNPATITGSGNTILTVTTSGSTPAANSTLTISGTSGTLAHTAQVTLKVVDFTIAVTPATQAVVGGGSTTYTVTTTAVNGFSGVVTPTVAGLPAGATASFSPATITGAGTSTMTVTTTSATPGGNSTLSVTGTVGTVAKTATATLTVRNFTVTATPATQTVTAGGSTTYTVTVTAVNGLTGDVALTVTGLPTGATASFSPSTITGSTGSSTLTVATSSATPTANSTLTITGTNGTLSQTTSVTLSVVDFTIAVTPATQTVVAGGSTTYTVTTTAVNGFSGIVTPTVAGLPAGATASFSPATITGAGTSTMTVTTTSATPGANSTLTVTGTSGPRAKTATATLAVQDFTFTVTPATQTVIASGSTTYTVTVTAVNGFTGTVTPTVSGLPAGATASFNPATITGGAGTSTMTVTTTSATPGANSTLTVTGSSGTDVKTAMVTLAVQDFTFTVTPATQTVIASGSTTYTVTVTAVNGFTGTVTPTVSGLPAGATASFNPATITGGAGTSTMTVTTSSATPGANSTLNVTGTSGTDVHSATVTLAVTNFTLNPSPATQAVLPGGSVTYTITSTAVNGLSGNVALTVTGLPTGATASFSPSTITGSTGSSTLTVATTSATAAANSTLTITGTNGTLSQTTSVTLSVVDFTIAVTPATQTVVAGGSTTYTVTTTAVNGFSGIVTPTVAGLPAGATASFSPATIMGAGSSTMTVTTSASTPAANSTLTVTGTSGTALHSAAVTLSVQDFTLSVSPATQTVTVGSSTSYTVTVVALNGFTGTVTPAVSGLPAGATATFSPATITGGAGSSTMTLSTTASTPGANSTLTVTGTSGTAVHSAAVTLSVQDFTLSVSPASQTVTAGGSTSYTVTVAAQNGFTSTVTPAVSGLPAGATATFSPATITGGAGSSTMTLSTTASTPGANSTLTVTGTSGTAVHSAAVTLGVQNFTLTATPATQTVLPGGSVTYTISSTAMNGLTGNMALTVAGLPSGATASFSPSTITGSTGTSTLTVTTSGTTPAANSTLTITGTNGTLAQTTSVTLSVVDFNITVTPATQTVGAGGSTTYTVTTTALNGFSGTVTPAVTGLPAGATTTFSPATITGAGSSTMTVTTSASTPAANSTLTVTGTSGSRSQSASGVTLSVTNFTIAISPATQTVNAGGSTTYTVTIAAVNGFTGSVPLSVTGLPGGTTASFSPATITGGAGSSTLTIGTSTSTPGGTTTFTVIGNNGGTPTQSTSANLTVIPPLVILRPTVDTQVGDAPYTNPALAQDGDPTTFASGTPAGAMGRGGEIWSGFGAGPSPRTTVNLKILSGGNCVVAQAEGFAVDYSLDGGASWTTIYSMGVYGGACTSRPEQTDVISLSAAQDLTTVQVRARFASFGNTTHQMYEIWIEAQ